MFSCCPPIQRIYHSQETTIKIGFVATGLLLVIVVIWKRHASTLFHSSAANWAFLGVCGLSLSLLLVSVTKHLKARNIPKELPLLDGRLVPIDSLSKRHALEIPSRPISSSICAVSGVAPDVWLLIFSYLDIYSLGRAQSVCSAFYNCAQKELLWKEAATKELPSFIEGPQSKQEVLCEMKFKKEVTKGEVSCFRLSDQMESVDCLFLVKDFVIFDAFPFQGIQIWKQDEADNWRCAQTIGNPDQYPLLLFSADNQLFISLEEKNISIWHLDEPKQKWVPSQTLEGHEMMVQVIFYANGMLFSGSCDGSTKIWKFSEIDGKWTCTQTLTSNVGKAAFSLFYADGLLFAGFSDNIIEIWKYNPADQNFEFSTSLVGHSIDDRGINRLCYAEGFLFSVGWELKIWKFKKDLNKWECLQTLEAGKKVCDLCYANGLMYTGSEITGEIKVWQLNSTTRKWTCSQTYSVGATINDIRYLSYSKGLLFYGFYNAKVLKSNN